MRRCVLDGVAWMEFHAVLLEVGHLRKTRLRRKAAGSKTFFAKKRLPKRT